MAAVSTDITKSIVEISNREDNILVIPNCIDEEYIKNRAEQKISFDEETRANVSLEELQEILGNGDKKFISIGRFSGEKRHDRLIEAFNRYWKENTDTWLIIIGGVGNLYEETCKIASDCEAGDHIILIRSMANPMPVLKNVIFLFLRRITRDLVLFSLRLQFWECR